jgi:predicted nucleic acid-binding protein
MVNVVLDTNAFVAAGFNPNSSSSKILKAVKNGAIDLVWNEATRRETQRMISKIPRLSWEPFAPLFKQENEHKGQVVADDYEFVEDPDDRKFAALGDATNSVIVTNDQHLLSQGDRLKAPVMTPSAFTELYADIL